MPTITVLPHEMYCPEGAHFDVEVGANLLDSLLEAGIDLPHACEFQGVCGQCHVHVRSGFSSLDVAQSDESDTLDGAWDMDMDSRLSCQATIGEEDLTIEIPKYDSHMR